MKNKELKIAIYSGNIPSSTFIEELINGVSNYHKVFLFGRKILSYPFLKGEGKGGNGQIFIYSFGGSTILNLVISLFLTVTLLIRYPKRFLILLEQLKKQRSFYQKRQSWIKITPVLLRLPDIFHIQWAKDLESWLFLKKLNVKIVLSLRGAHINYSPISDARLASSYRRNFPQVDAFHAVSEAIAKEAQKYGADSYRIHVIHSLLPKSTLNSFELTEKPKANHLNILSVGRHHWKKGYSTALDACKILKERQLSFSYRIIAGESIPEELIVQKHQLGLLKEVHFERNMSQQEVFQCMKNCDVLLLPSYEEGIANVVLEAMALGIPVISSDCGGMREVVIPNETGKLFSNLESNDLADLILEFNNSSKEEIQKQVQAGYNLVSEKFDKDTNIRDFTILYSSIH